MLDSLIGQFRTVRWYQDVYICASVLRNGRHVLCELYCYLPIQEML